MKINISVIGSGYVGTTTAAVLANCGYRIVAVDIDLQKIEKLRQGKAPFFEHGLDELLEQAVINDTLIATSSYTSLVDADIVFSCVGTPDNPDGSSNLDYVFAAAKEALQHMSNSTIFVQKSTVPVGTGARIEEIFKLSGKSVLYVSNPEFLREGSAIADTIWFDRIVAGGTNKQAVDSVLNLYRSVEKCRDKIAMIASVSTESEPAGAFISTNLSSAELIKVTSNAFLALKISFANSIAKLADQVSADINEVMDAVGADRRIGRAFLNAGRGYGGGCFPKDVSGLISSAAQHGVDMPIMIAVTDVNESMPGYIVNKIQNCLGSLKNKRIAVLGLSFKAGTSDARKSPGVKIANMLDKNSADVQTYDTHVTGEVAEELRRGVKIHQNMNEALAKCDAVVIATDWPEFKDASISELVSLMTGNLFIDAMNCFDKNQVTEQGMRYIGVGR